jgi:hypothetical protein
LPGIDEAGAALIKARAAELVSVKAEEEERIARETAENEARLRAEAEALAAIQRAEAGQGGTPLAPPTGPAADREG